MQLNLTFNSDKNGIELRFSEKPEAELTRFLSDLGCKYSYRQQMWYAPNSDQRREVFTSLQSALQNGLPISDIGIPASFSADPQHIDQRKFSVVTIYYTAGEDQPTAQSYVVFEPSKKVAMLIAKQFAFARYGDAYQQIELHSRCRKKQARSLFTQGHIIHPNQIEENTEWQDNIDENSVEADQPSTVVNDEAILEELYNMKRTNALDRSLLEQLGIQTPLLGWHIPIGPYLLSRTSTFRYRYDLKKNST